MTSKEIKDNFGRTHHTCCACDVRKPMKDFNKNNHLTSGFMGRCKDCKNKGICCRKGNKKMDSKRKSNGLYMFNTSKKDWIDMFLVLEKLGYSLESSIHEQFCKRHNLPLKKADKKDRTIKYTPKDLGLI